MAGRNHAGVHVPDVQELSGAVYPKSGIRDAFHNLSHHSNVEDNMDRFAVLNAYHSNCSPISWTS